MVMVFNMKYKRGRRSAAFGDAVVLCRKGMDSREGVDSRGEPG
jgi:hypothetical protein